LAPKGRSITLPSPYADLASDQWAEKTQELIDAHPLDVDDIVDVVLTCWTAIFECSAP